VQSEREDGYELWLRYRKVSNPDRLAQYRQAIHRAGVFGKNETAEIIRGELERALPALLDADIPFAADNLSGNALMAGTVRELGAAGIDAAQDQCSALGDEGFLIQSQPEKDSDRIVITANSDHGVFYGIFHFLRLLQTQQDIRELKVIGIPRIRRRILSHWDNLDGSVERGYAGASLWKWSELAGIFDPRYRDYARACASVGINGTILNNVNAQTEILQPDYLNKAAALANLFRPYGIRVYLSAPFSAPMQLGGLGTNDPREAAVATWWRNKIEEIYRWIPDFGGFQVKANSEGRAGPQDYGATHDDGANMLAKALEPHGGVVFWRAFVYDTTIDPDRAKCAYKEFAPLDGNFRSNVFVQVKNGPIDFQPREPFHPLFGAMDRTPLALELQITQEYLGQSVHLVYLACMWKEILESETYANGPGSSVGGIVYGSVSGGRDSSIVGVANTGADRNWCGHHFAQANWYAFGRLAWDSQLSAETIADEWIRATWSNDPLVVEKIKFMMLGSWQACIDYMVPLGLHHLMQEGHHYGPDPDFHTAVRPDWNNVYYHRADAAGIGFDRSSGGSNAVGQYRSPLREQFDRPDPCPEKYLLWFHHIPWETRLRTDRTVWEELQYRYHDGVAYVEKICGIWRSLRVEIDPERYEHVANRLAQQLENARLWRDTCIHYFGQFIGEEDSE